MGAEGLATPPQTCGEGLATPQKTVAPSGRKRRGKASVEGAGVKRQRSGHCRPPVPSVMEQLRTPSCNAEEHCVKVAKIPASPAPAAKAPRSPLRLMRLPEPSASHPVVRLTGHLPGSRRIPAWMQVYSSVGRDLHQAQPAYASQDGKYLLYNSSGPGVGQGWWLGRSDHGTESAAALAFLPSGHSEWWVLDKGIPQQSAQVIITNVWGDDAPGLKPQKVQQQAEKFVGKGEDTRQLGRKGSDCGLLRLSQPGAGHTTIQLTGHLPGECRIPAWMQVYNSTELLPQGHSTYASQDGKYLLYNSSGPGVAQGWWLGHAADGISSAAALAFLPGGHDEWWVLDQGSPHQAQVIITTHASDKASGLKRSPAPQEQPKLPAANPPASEEASITAPPALPEPTVTPAQPHCPVLPLQQELPPTTASHVSTTESPVSTDLQPLSAPLTGKGSIDAPASILRAPAAKLARTTTSAEGQVVSKKNASSAGAFSRSASYSGNLDRIALSTRSTSSTNSLDRMVRDFDKDARDSIDRIARAFSGSVSDSVERIARSTSRSPGPFLDTGSDAQQQLRKGMLANELPPVFAPPLPIAFGEPDDAINAITARGGICARKLSLVIGPAEGGGFLDMPNLKKQDRLLRSFEKMMLKMESTAGSLTF